MIFVSHQIPDCQWIPILIPSVCILLQNWMTVIKWKGIVCFFFKPTLLRYNWHNTWPILSVQFDKPCQMYTFMYTISIKNISITWKTSYMYHAPHLMWFLSQNNSYIFYKEFHRGRKTACFCVSNSFSIIFLRFMLHK